MGTTLPRFYDPINTTSVTTRVRRVMIRGIDWKTGASDRSLDSVLWVRCHVGRHMGGVLGATGRAMEHRYPGVLTEYLADLELEELVIQMLGGGDA